MRKQFAAQLSNLLYLNSKILLLTGDLGFMAFETIRDSFPKQFINMGVAEQNMVGVAAGLSFRGFIPFVYSIAPFVTLRCLEQIKNDVCFQKLPVKFVGNGGGYGYGIMGPTHHGIEDITLMRSLPGMKVYIPSFSTDIEDILNAIVLEKGPCYLRLGYTKDTTLAIPKFKPIRKIISGEKVLVCAVGPIIFNALDAIDRLLKNGKIGNNDVDLWSISMTPLFPNRSLTENMATIKKIIVLE